MIKQYESDGKKLQNIYLNGPGQNTENNMNDTLLVNIKGFLHFDV